MSLEALRTPADCIDKYNENRFHHHCQYTLDNFLLPWAYEHLSCNESQNILIDNQCCAVIVETRVNKQLEFAVLNTLLMTRLKIRIILFTTASQKETCEKRFHTLTNWIEVREIPNLQDDETFNVSNYNHLLLDKSFWEQIHFKQCLVFQTDGMLIEPLDFAFFQYEYIGAPWTPDYYTTQVLTLYSPDLSNEIAVYPLTRKSSSYFKQENLMVGNGGFSIRSTSLMAEILTKEKPRENEPEDIFFSRHLKNHAKIIPPLTMARAFSCETVYFPAQMMHRSYANISPSDQANMYSRHFSNVITMLYAKAKFTIQDL